MMKHTWPILIVFASATLLAAQTATRPEKKASAAAAPGDEWKIVFADDFDKPGPPDPDKWVYEVGYLRNHEAQYYTRARKENARVEDGRLILEARREAYPIAAAPRNRNRAVAEYTSASLTSKQTWTYGRIEVKAKLPTGRGTWPAIWMLGASFGAAGWPACGEIDIMENVGFDPDTIHANIHVQKYNHVKGTGKGSKITIPRPYEDYHVYSADWYPDRIDFRVDGRKYFTFENEKTGNDAWPFDKPQRLKLNLAIGGDWGGQKGIDTAIFPQRMEIRSVRVYQRSR
jgi:beta-glucanase (GH16 family)